MMNPNKDKFKLKERDGIFVKKSVVKTGDFVGKEKTYKLGNRSITVSKIKEKPTPENIKRGSSKRFKDVVKKYKTPNDEDFKVLGTKQKSKEFDGSKSRENARYAHFGKEGFYKSVTKDSEGKNIRKEYENKKGKTTKLIEIEKPKSGGKTITISKPNKKGNLIPKETIYKPSLKEKISNAFDKLKNR